MFSESIIDFGKCLEIDDDDDGDDDDDDDCHSPHGHDPTNPAKALTP